MATPREIEDLVFARYREQGDPDLLAQVFDHTAPRLLRLAIHLSRDPAEAEDLVQATFVTAIEKARSFETHRPVLPWLTGILQHHARESRSRAHRQPSPERLRNRPVATPAEHAESKELDEAVAKGLDKLPERYRPVMVLKLRHGLKPAQIADALGRSPGAVRVQIHRGTELLRNYLPLGLAMSTLVGVTPTLGLAAMRSEIRRHAATQVSLAVQTVGVGGLIMKKTTTVVLGLLLATGAALYVGTDFAPVPLVDGGRGTGTEALGAPLSDTFVSSTDLETERAPSPSPERSPLMPVGSVPSGGAIFVRALWEDDRTPARGVGLTIRPHDGRHPDLHTERQVTGGDGAILFGGLEAGSYGVYVDREASRPEDVADSANEEASLWQSGSVVLEAEQFVLRGTTVDLSLPTGRLMYLPRIAATTAPSSDFHFEYSVGGVQIDRDPLMREAEELSLDELRDLLNDLRASSRLPDEEPVAVETVTDEVVYVDVLVDRGLVVEGRVLDPDGDALAGAQIWVRGKSRDDAHLLAHSDGRGRFRLEGMETSSRVWARAKGFLATDETKIVKDHGDDGLELRFTERAAELRARVVDRSGEPVVGASLRIGDPGDDPKPVQLRSDADGRAATDGIPPGSIPVLVLASGYQPYRELLEIRTEEEARDERVFVLYPGWIAEGYVRNFEGEGQEGTTIFADAEGKPTTEVTTGPDGAFRLECLPPGPVSLRVEEGKHRGLVVPIQGNSGDVQTRDLILPPWGEIAGRIVDENGQPLSGWNVRAVSEAGAPRTDRSGESGAFSISTEPDLSYRLEVQPVRGDTFQFYERSTGQMGQVHLVGAWSTSLASSTSAGRKKIPVTWLGVIPGIRDDVEIVIPPHLVPSATIRGRIADAAGNPMEGSIQVYVDGGSRRERLDKQGAFDIGPLIPGDYEFQVVTKDREFPDFYLDVRGLVPNQELDVGTILPPVGGNLYVSVLDGRAEPGTVSGRVLDSMGRQLATLDSLGPLGKTVLLPPGSYTVEVLQGDTVVGKQSARVMARETTPLSIQLQ